MDTAFVRDQLIRKFAIVSEADRSGSVLVRALDGQGLWLLFANGSARHVYAEQHKKGTMLEGVLLQPGEHHTRLPAPVPAGAVFLPEKSYWGSHDQHLATLLQQTEGALLLGKREWKWHQRPGGRTYFVAEWAAQVSSAGEGTSLSMRGLQPDVFDEVNLVGMAYFLRVAWTLQTALQGTPQGPPAPPPYETMHGETAAKFFADEDLWAPPAEPRDRGNAILEMLMPFASDQITIGTIPPKRQKIVDAALPPAAAHLPVLAVLGEKGLLKHEALVVTPTHGFLSYKEFRQAFAWSEIVETYPSHNTVFLRSERLGWIPTPACGKGEALAAALHALVTLNQSE